jgi:hypothetical protein
MMIQNIAAIKALIDTDPTATAEERKTLNAALEQKTVKPKVIPITPKEAASMIGCHVATLRRWEKQGLLMPKRYTARKIRYDRNEVEKFITEGANYSEVA